MNDNVETTQKTTQEILSLLEENPFISQKEIAASLQNITVDGVKCHINKMKKANFGMSWSIDITSPKWLVNFMAIW